MCSFPNLESAHCHMSNSHCCSLTCIQISQQTGKVVWCSHLFKNFPQFAAIHTAKGFSLYRLPDTYIGSHHISFGKEYSHKAGDPGSTPGLGRSVGEGNGNPLQYSCLEDPMDGGALFIGEGNDNPLKCSCLENPRNRGAWWAAVYGVA